MDEFTTFLSIAKKEDRIIHLKNLKRVKKSFTLCEAKDLLALNLEIDEKTLILELVSADNNLEFELFITDQCRIWDQNLSSIALLQWAKKSKRHLWHRILTLVNFEHTPQRIKYTILLLTPYVGGRKLLEIFAQKSDLHDMSPAFHSLLLKRSIQWNFHHPKFLEIVVSNLKDLDQDEWPQKKSLVSALCWLRHFDYEFLNKIYQSPHVQQLWKEVIKTLILTDSVDKDIEKKLAEKLTNEEDNFPIEEINLYWPLLWQRNHLSTDLLYKIVLASTQHPEFFNNNDLQILDWIGGVTGEQFIALMEKVTNETEFLQFSTIINGYLDENSQKKLTKEIEKFYTNSIDKKKFIDHLDISLQKTAIKHTKKGAIALPSVHEQIINEQIALETSNYDFSFKFHSISVDDNFKGTTQSEKSRHQFFNLVYRKVLPKDGSKYSDDFWGGLTKAWVNPSSTPLSELAIIARQQPALVQVCYLKVLGRYVGDDEAALKILDFIRSDDPIFLSEIIRSLSQIGTPRALQELLALLTRPNITLPLQIEICEAIRLKNLNKLQDELKSTILDIETKMKNDEQIGSQYREIYESLSSLINVIYEQNKDVDIDVENGVTELQNSQEIDASLCKRIPQFNELSGEVKRALRTSQFFYQQISNIESNFAIDLSPVIDMQYKALELLFRERFENICHKIISNGLLQQKLDIIGYARPIPKLMDEFENYINNLPIINEVPYFSKFKLRKLLRGICMFRPGKRFTLDGIKAFSLFFLTFGRKKCKFHLDGLCNLGFNTDHDLFKFCSDLHIFQDFRNRAAHEGFRPEARNDIEGIWQRTSNIIGIVLSIEVTKE